MTLRQLLLPAFSMLILITGAACGQYEFSESSTERILKELSSDELRGRQAFTPGADKAAELIADEFTQIGLSNFGELDNYMQDFNMNKYAIQQFGISLNGTELPADHYFGFIYSESLNWTPETVDVTGISADENFRDRLNELTSGSENMLIFVDEQHSEIFSRYQAYFSQQNSRSMEGENEASFIFVLAPPSNEFNISVQAELIQNKLTNVVGTIEGKRPDELVLFSAHYDHIGIQARAEGDSIANGANDNASGVTAVIELARYFERMPQPERTLVFVGFTAEEMGGYGSQYFSNQLDPDNIVAMFNIEMVGKPAVSGPNTAWITGYERSTFGELLSKSAEGSIYEFYPDPYPDQNLFYRSDNATLARLGVPAHTISTTPIDVDPDYHQVSDEFDTIDISHLTNTIKAIARAAEGIVSGEDTPTRVDAGLMD